MEQEQKKGQKVCKNCSKPIGWGWNLCFECTRDGFGGESKKRELEIYLANKKTEVRKGRMV